MKKRSLTLIACILWSLFVPIIDAVGRVHCPRGETESICTPALIDACLVQLIDENVEFVESVRKRLSTCEAAQGPLVKMMNQRTSADNRRIFAASLLIDISANAIKAQRDVIRLLEENNENDKNLRRLIINDLRNKSRYAKEYRQVMFGIINNPARDDIERVEAVRYFSNYDFSDLDAQDNIVNLIMKNNGQYFEVQYELIDLLSKFNSTSVFALEAMVRVMTGSEFPLNEESALAIQNICVSLLTTSEISAIPMLQSALQEVKKVDNTKPLQKKEIIDARKSMETALSYLTGVRDQGFVYRVVKAVEETPWLLIIPIYILWFAIVQVWYWRAPLIILSAAKYMEFLSTTVGGKLGSTIKSVESLFLIPFMKNRPRVLDAWVDANIGPVRQQFLSKSLYCQSIYLKQQPELSIAELQKMFRDSVKTTLWIWGKPGSGKTSLAYFIGLCAMQNNPSQRLFPHLSIPLMFSEEIDAGPEQSLLVAISNRLNNLTSETGQLKLDFIKVLLTQGRILVIVDWFKELDRKQRKLIQPDSQGCSIAAKVIVSESEKGIDDFTLTSVNTKLITESEFKAFVRDFLRDNDRRDLIDDSEITKLLQNYLAMAVNSATTKASIVELLRKYINEKDKLAKPSLYKSNKKKTTKSV